MNKPNLQLRLIVLAVSAAFAASSQSALADPINAGGNAANLPTSGVTNSAVSGSSVGTNSLTVNLNGRAVIDWSTFNVGSGYSMNFVGPGSAVLNRVPQGNAPGGSTPNVSNINGAVNGSGVTVMLMNPNGIVFGAGAQVNVGALVATTGQIDENEFKSTSNPRAVITYPSGYPRAAITVNPMAQITAETAGLVALVAPSVTNQGMITATSGKIILAGEEAVTISLNGLYEMTVDKTAAGSMVTNKGELHAGTILVSAQDASSITSGLVNLEGIQQATSIEVNGNHVALKSDLNATAVAGASRIVDVCGCAQVQDGIDIAATGATVNVVGGTHNEQLNVNKAGLTLNGQEGAKITVPDGPAVNGVTISADDVTVSGFEIAGPVSSSYLTYAWGSNISRGIVVGNGVQRFTIANNNIHDIRTGILIDGRNTGSVSGNRIENTKSGISVQYTDASGIAISSNSEGPTGNEWGLNLHLNGFLDGGTIYTNPHAAAPTLSWQQSLLALGSANGGWGVQDQGYSSSNRTRATVAPGGLAANQGSALTPLDTIENGINAVVTGGRVNLAPGTYTRASTLYVNKSVTLAGAGQALTTIDARGVTAAMGGYGMSVTADNVTLRDFTFYGPSAFYASAYGIKVSPGGTASSRLHNFTITNVTSRGAGKAELDLNGVAGATIDHFTANGAPVGNDTGTTQGAGIQITDSADVTITNSTTRNNAWGGIALYQANRSYDQQTSNITIDAASNDLREASPLYLQDESASKNFDFTTLHLTGFPYAVRNTATVGSGPGATDYSQYTWLQKTAQGAFDLSVNLLAPDASYIQGWTGSALTQAFHVGVGNTTGGISAMRVQTAVDRADPGATINVYPGSYLETASNRTIPGVGGTYTLGLLLDKSLSLRGVDASGAPITSADNVQAWIRSGAITNFGMAHAVTANDVTVEGLGFKPYSGSLNKTIEIQADNFVFRNNVVDNRFEAGTGGTPAGGAGALYFGENDPTGHPINRLTVTGNKFLDGSVTLTNGVGANGASYTPASDRVISNNTFIGSSNYTFGGVLLTGQMAEIPWRTMPIGAATVTGNRFSGFDDSVMVRGDQQGIDLRQVMANNSFDRSVLVTDSSGNARGETYQSTPDGTHFTPRLKYSIQSSLQAGVNRASSGDTVAVGAGSYAENVVVNKPLNFALSGPTVQSMVFNSNTGVGGSATANGAGFTFNAPVTLLGNLSLATSGGNIVFNGDIQNAAMTPYALGLSTASGDVLLASGGTESNPIGFLSMTGNDFTLSGTLWVTGYNLNASGNIALSDHSLHATSSGGTNVLVAGGNVSGTTVSESAVIVSAGGNVTGTTLSDGTVVVNAGGDVQLVIAAAPGSSVTAGGTASVQNVGTAPVEVNGEQRPNVRMTSLTNNQIIPPDNALPRQGNAPAAPPKGGGGREIQVAAESAGDALDQGFAVEIDLTPAPKKRK